MPLCTHCNERPAILPTQTDGVCLECFDADFMMCETTNLAVPISEMVSAVHYEDGMERLDLCEVSNTTLVESTGQRYTPEAMLALFFECEECGGEFRTSERVNRRGVEYCGGCAPPLPSLHSREPHDQVLSETFEECPSQRCFGIEIEAQHAYEASASNETAFGSKGDGSLHNEGAEFYSPIMQGDAGLTQLKNVLEMCESEGAIIDEECGLHIHIDLRDFSHEELARLFFVLRKVENVTRLLIPRDRAENSHCRYRLTQFEVDIDTPPSVLVETVIEGHRYHGYNFKAYYQHKTIEVRLHQGSLDYEEIRNWLLLHLYIVDYAKETTEENFELLEGLDLVGVFEMMKGITSTRVSEYYDAALERFNNKHHFTPAVVTA